MKKALFGIFLGLLCCIAPRLSQASPLNYDSRLVKYTISVPSGTTSTNTIVISLADTVNYPHKFSRELQIRGMRMEIDKVAASTCTVKLGVMTFVNSSTGTVKFFTQNGNDLNVSNTDLGINYYLDNLAYNLHVDPLVPITDTNGATPYFASNDTLDGSSAFNNTTKLPSTTGGAIPKVGDLIMNVSKDGSNAIKIYLEVLYYGSN